MPLPLSITVITLNEERNLGRCLESVAGLGAEIVVVDSGSTDGTRDIALAHGARFIVNAWPGFIKQNAFAGEQCTQPWVLALDADEALTPELRAAIESRLGSERSAGVDGYLMSRRTFYLGAWIWHVWYPEWRLRLMRKAAARWVGEEPHGRCDVTGPSERLPGDLLHYSFRSFNEHLQKTMAYARTSAEAKHRKGAHFNGWRMLLSPWFRFLRDVFLKSGWRDGWRGVLIAYVGAFSSFAKQAYQFELDEAAGKGGSKP